MKIKIKADLFKMIFISSIIFVISLFVTHGNSYACGGTVAACSYTRDYICYINANNIHTNCQYTAHSSWDPVPCKVGFCGYYVDSLGNILPSCSALIHECNQVCNYDADGNLICTEVCTDTPNPCAQDAQDCFNRELPFCAQWLTTALNTCESNYTNNKKNCDTAYNTCVAPCLNITATAGSGGGISPSGTVSGIEPGSNRTFVITPNSLCYHITDVLVDGSSVGAVSSYTFNNITANHTITASFASYVYTFTATAGSGGTITPSSATVNCGGSQCFTITPNSCNHIVDVPVDGVSKGPITSYCFSNVTANHTISATFSNTYKLTITKLGTGTGTVTSSPAGLTCGATCTAPFLQCSNVNLTATPNSGYSFAGWSGGGCSGMGSCTVAMNANTTVTATFNMIPPVANFSCSPTSGIVPLAVTCTDLSTYNPSAWLWNFGDGTTSNLKNPSHVYTGTGPYTITLTALNNGGSNMATKTNYITTNPCTNFPANGVRIAGTTPTYYSTLQAAYNAAPDGAVIQMLGLTFPLQSLTANRNISVSLEGGKSCDYSSTVGATTLQGSITTSLGTLTVKDFILTP